MSAGSRELFEVRAELLKARGCLVDPSTRLPTLPAVIDEVRRRLESGLPLGLILLDLSGEEHLEEVYGWQTYDGLLQQVAEALREVDGHLLGDRDVVSLLGVRSDQFVVFAELPDHGAGRALQGRRESLVAELGRRLRIQVGNELPRGLAVHSAATLLRHDPTVRVERSIYKTIDEARVLCLRDRDERRTQRLEELRRILAERDILIRYQPIVQLGDASIFGYEALACGPKGDLFESPEMMFSFAERTDHIQQLERLCRHESVRGARLLARGRKLFLNTSAHGVVEEGLASGLLAHATEVGMAPEDVVLEITERVAVTAWSDFRRRLDLLRDAGFSVAIDDMGAGYSSLHSVAEIEPDFLKVDIALVRDVHQSPIKRGLLESLVLLAARIGATVIAEGVEKEEEHAVLREMGVALGQGYLFSPPSTLSFHLPETG